MFIKLHCEADRWCIVVHDSCERTGPFWHVVGWCATEPLEAPVFRPFKPIRHVRFTVHGLCVWSAL